MKEVTTKIYKYAELSEEAKKVARAKWVESGIQYDWWDQAYEDIHMIAETFGLDFDTGHGRSDIRIYFSGFSSQGDGACFEGYYSYKKSALKKIKENYPKEIELHRIVKELQELQKKTFYSITAKMKHGGGHYNHSRCMDVDVNMDERIGPDLFRSTEEGVTQCMRDFADWIYKKLEKESDWLQSDEAVDETLKENDDDYEEDGTKA
jgi:hypothetical protein